MSDAIPVPQKVVQAIEEYVYSALSKAKKYDNSTPLDESGIWSLHRVAARIYAMGFDAGERIEAERNRAEHQRARNAKCEEPRVVHAGDREMTEEWRTLPDGEGGMIANYMTGEKTWHSKPCTKQSRWVTQWETINE